ncbi:MAG: hypothetical protein PHC35_08445 [Deltaproteobacteria bacterium]|nr:hypothetical protein [Deltaproteobacteria bacterium]
MADTFLNNIFNEYKKDIIFLGSAAVKHLFHAAHNCPSWQDAPPAPFMAPISQTLHHCRPFRPCGTPCPERVPYPFLM